MKKNNKVLYIIIAIVVLIGIFLVYKFAFSSENSHIIPITVNELESKINNKDSFILVITQTGCSHCEQYLPELEYTLEEVNLEAYDLNITGISDDEQKKLAKHVNFNGTPTTVFYTNGEEKTTLNRIIGFASKAKIKERLKSLGYIN